MSTFKNGEAILATTVTFADKSDPQSGPVKLSLAEANMVLAGSATEIEETVMDKGYHENGMLAGAGPAGCQHIYPRAAAKRPALDRHLRPRKGLSDRSSEGARQKGAAVEPAAQ